MKKIKFKPGNMLYPLPAVLISCGTTDGQSNLFTAAWTGTICTNPPMLSVSIRPERYSYRMIRESREFVVNLTTKELCFAADFCGVRSGRDVDKWKACHLTKIKADTVSCPMVKESPVNIECHVTEIKELGSHHMFLAEVTTVHVDEAYMDDKNTFHLNKSGLITYSHGKYFTLGKKLGHFGYSVQKKGQASKKHRANRSTIKKANKKRIHKEL